MPEMIEPTFFNTDDYQSPDPSVPPGIDLGLFYSVANRSNK